MNKLLYLLISSFLIFSCEEIKNATSSSSQNDMQKDAARVIQFFCASQKKQIAASQKVAEYKEKGQQPPESIFAELDDASKDMQQYTTALDSLMKKYKGSERTIHQILKKGQLNCR